MIGIGKPVVYTFISVLVILFSAIIGQQQVFAQDFQVQATVSENKIFTGEQFTLNIEVTGTSMRDVSLPVLPDIPGTRVLSTTPSRSTSISIVNGETSTSFTYSFTLIAREIGTYTIPPVEISVDGTEYRTNPIEIEILERGDLSQDGQQQLPDIFLELELDTTTPVTGQQIVASVVLYFKQGIEVSSFQPASGWRTDGFWKEELENIRQPQAESVILNGVRYRSATLVRYALFPTHSGELSLEEFSLNVSVRTQSSRNDPFGSFFGSGTNQRRILLESEPITLNVKEVPGTQNALTINGVGDLQVERRLTKNEVVTGETIELVTTVSGVGNIPLIRRPDYTLPDGLERYTPQESSNVERRGLTIQGSKTFTELIASRAPGQYQIPSATVSVYNPQLNRYQTITLPALTFQARPGSQIAESQGSMQTFQLQPVTGLATWSNGSQSSLFSTVWFWVLLIIPAIAFIVAFQKRKLANRLDTDRKFARAHFADNTVKERFEHAWDLVDEGNAKEIYGTLHKTITGYITDKLSLPEAGLSDNEILEKLQEHNISQSVISRVRQSLDKCATISYAPTGSSSDFKSDISKSEKLVKELREEFS